MVWLAKIKTSKTHTHAHTHTSAFFSLSLTHTHTHILSLFRTCTAMNKKVGGGEWFCPLAINLSYLIILSALQFESALGKKIINVLDSFFALLNHSKEDAVNFNTTFIILSRNKKKKDLYLNDECKIRKVFLKLCIWNFLSTFTLFRWI